MGQAFPLDDRGAGTLSIEGERFDLFRWMPQDVQQAFKAASRPRSVPAGGVIYLQGDRGTEMFRILSGTVRLTSINIDGRELMYALFGAPACFGFSTLIDGEGLPHTATAQSDVQLDVVGRVAFLDLRARFRAFDEAMLQSLCGHMRMLSAYVGDALLEDLPRRLARRLLNMVPGDGAPVIQLSQFDLAAMLGASRQSVNKLLKQFEEEGLVRVSYGTLELRDIEGLRDRAI